MIDVKSFPVQAEPWAYDFDFGKIVGGSFKSSSRREPLERF
ncbi:hypothetical protein Rvan_2442 [Rhodomicrobium vannielii ATCC 17100]|uniref:Uncharacterized protein n=1 Tax=Rhodomicrobium vannielii (strain ATCC 17100 / DSM 162 / LMG 4299 / NCIMB 10020 / ATH 3.1.1) TaxID=648757 RepID=E3I5E1_RHOVT|nr:hypothetical protein Rvan_2442 [Rhodomicrobium vannielii ATCC 17100]